MSNAFIIKPATRQGVKPLIGFYSESGCGKTMSSLLLARGLAGPSGKIVLCDTESGRGSLYADVIPGGYDVLELRDSFSPSRYIEAIQAAEKFDPSVIVIDSGSHQWEGIGGVLDMAGENESRSGRPGLHNWRLPKMEHAKFMLKLLQSTVPIIVCLRAKHKTRQGKDERGKTAIVKDDFTTPIQADDFIFEMTCHGEIMQDHSFRLTKCSHPSLRECFPVKGPITIQHGEALARWCANPGKAGDPKAEPKASPSGASNPTPKAGGSTPPPAASSPAKKVATEATRSWMLEELLKTFDETSLMAYAIDRALIMPSGENLRDWPLNKVPTNRGDLVDLCADVDKWRGK